MPATGASGNPPAGGSGTGDPPDTGGTGGASTGTGGPSGSADVVINKKQFTSDPSWLADLRLDRLKSNWEEWDRRLNLVVDQRNFSYYLDESLPCPDPVLHPRAALNWGSCDRALRTFILEHVSNVEYGIAKKFKYSHEVYDALRRSHENLDDINGLHERFTKMGKMDDDKLKILLYINSLDPLPQLQSAINEMLSNSSVTSAEVKERVIQEEQLLQRREVLGIPLTTGQGESTTLAATTTKPRLACANCKRSNH
ncbi:hypothetical protein EDB92DRAFT_1938768 [Lactarius akahatsu]|uniref:Uncharacterized protein n=1 Tax=Lactarius akahatsu TaxID=416441 RepID=A0AAD4LR04_9AGAM|nr:hypothetical protein EDB92DRAFT_1938768 [Lactarius akahatsu]